MKFLLSSILALTFVLGLATVSFADPGADSFNPTEWEKTFLVYDGN